MKAKNNLKYLLVGIIIFFPIFFTVNYFLKTKINSIMDGKFSTISQSNQELLRQSIKDKSYATLNIALSLSEYIVANNLFEKNNLAVENLKNISLKMRAESNFKNVWVQLINKDGVSRYRSWSPKKDDNLLKVRKELIPLLKNPKVTSTISVGIFDLTFKSIIPVYKDDKLLGLVEVITKFNSIAEKFKKEGTDLVILVDKKYKNQIKKPFTKLFVEDYYVANKNAKPELMKLTKQNIDTFINIDNYMIKNNKFITTYTLNDFKNEKMAYLIAFQNYDKIFLEEIQDLEDFIHIIGFLFTLTVIAVFSTYYYFNKSKYTKTLEKEVKQRTNELDQLIKRYKQLFEGSQAIKVLVDPQTKQIFDANGAALKFYGYSKKEIKKLKSTDINVDIDNNSEVFSQILNKEKNYFIFKHKLSNGEIRDVEVFSSVVDFDDKQYIYSIIRDITEDLKLRKDYEEKQKLLYQQAKMASMGEMLENIAHQWRQPLSTITTAASGVKINKELNSLDDKFLDDSINIIVKSANFLSQTIEDFRNFFKHTQNIESFKISSAINECINILKIKLDSNKIDIHIFNEKDITINGYKNELIQVILNLVNNSIDVFKSLNIEKKIILIKIYESEENIIIVIQDNANGIDYKIIEKIFDPYFTTKHKSQGTGIGLYMSEQIITKHFNGEISVKNSEFEFDSKEYIGAKFKIKFPKDLETY